MSDETRVVIAFPTIPCVPPVLQISDEVITFEEDPDGSGHWLAEVSKDDAAHLLQVPGVKLWVPAAPTPDASWGRGAIADWAQKNLDLTLNPTSSKKADMLAAIAAAQPAPAPAEAPVESPADPSTAF